jgi:hypothetical protein
MLEIAEGLAIAAGLHQLPLYQQQQVSRAGLPDLLTCPSNSLNKIKRII